MSFRFNKETFENNSFNEQIRQKLTKALNPVNGTSASGSDSIQESSETKSTPDILKSGITVRKVNFPTIPQLEILDLDVSSQAKSLLKGICKISCKDAMLQITTEIEANLLLLYAKTSPSFTTPRLISNDSFIVPITMTFNCIQLEAITNIFVKSTGVGISFNDVNLDFKFECSIKLLQSSIEKRLKDSMEAVFKDVLPSVIFNMSQRWFTHGESTLPISETAATVPPLVRSPKTILDDSDLLDLSPASMLRLSTLVSSRQSLSLNPTMMNTISTIPGCLERQNLHRFDSRIPSLNNYYPNVDGLEQDDVEVKLMGRSSSNHILPSNAYRQQRNTLPQHVVDQQTFDLKTIATIQSRIYERRGGNDLEELGIRRRKIKLGKKRAQKRAEPPAEIPGASAETPPVREAAESQRLLSPQPHSALHSPQPLQPVRETTLSPCSSETTAETAFVTTPQLDVIPSLTLPVSVTRDPKPMPPRLSFLDDGNYFAHRPDFNELRSSLYSPLKSNRFYVASDAEKPLLENKRLSFVGLSNPQQQSGWKWGNDDMPPPYGS